MEENVYARKRSVWKWILGAFLVLLLGSYFLLAYFMGGPRDAYGFLRYALPQWHEGSLHVGEVAPDARVFSLDGHTAHDLHEWIGKRPFVLIFGSYT
ncbi:MAG TPA: hypothetical protein VKB26_01940 [Candidatus Acidoferrales bacterium]|nr:hypothetical protein [Candidatus Acidoferrales bacterium]